MRNRWLGFVVAAVALALGVWAWPRLPARVPTHWNIHGVPDGHSSRLVAVLLMPGIVLGLNGLFRVLPRLDPRRVKYEKVQDTYWLIANAPAAFVSGPLVWILLAAAAVLAVAVPVVQSYVLWRREQHEKP